MDKKLKPTTKELFEFDRAFSCVLGGSDEAGRGPLAGPVVCAACIMPLDDMIDGVNDSKAISEKRREILFDRIVKTALSYKIVVVDCKTIDEINILNATKKGMMEAINGLDNPENVLVDAVEIQANYPVIPIIKGDAKSYNIAAASILAKVFRDKIMRDIHNEFPIYGFDKHKGYGTAAHILTLKQHGACEYHRRTFIKNFIDDIEKNSYARGKNG